MTEPRVVRAAALVARAPDALLDLGVRADDHPTLACRDLLVRIERQHGDVRVGSGVSPLAVVRSDPGAEGLARVRQDRQPERLRDRTEPRKIRGVTEDVVGQDRRDTPSGARVVYRSVLLPARGELLRDGVG